MGSKQYFWSFGGGEVDTTMYGRIDDVVFQVGAAKVRNFIVSPRGPVHNRQGTRIVGAVKHSSKRTRIIPFQFSESQSMIIEMGHEFMRFHTLGQTLMYDGAPYEIQSPYQEEDLFDIGYEQSADVMTLTHTGYQTRELRRLGATAWELREAGYGAPIDPPSSVTVTSYMPSSASVNTDIYVDCNYIVTAVNKDKQESAASSIATASNQLYITGARNTIDWSAAAVTGADRYRVYKDSGGLYGYIGETFGTDLIDDNIAPDMGRTPPIYDSPFSDVGKILSVPVTSGGSGYGANGGVVTDVRLVSSATYGINVSRPTGEIVDPTGLGATITVNAFQVDLPGNNTAGWKISGATLNNGGSGYTNPSVLMDDTPIVSGKTEWEVEFTPNDIVFEITDPGGGSGAELEAVVSAGVLTGIIVRNGGKGYVTPTVTITNGRGGSGAVIGSPVVGSTTDYPGTVAYHDQRKCFAGSTAKPQHYWMTRSGTESDMSYTIPEQDDNRVENKLASRSVNRIRHLMSMNQLLALTNSMVWEISSADGIDNPITPTSLKTRIRSGVGSAKVKPLISGERLIYCAEKGKHLFEFVYELQVNGYVAGDLSIRAPHLFDGYDVIDMAAVESPVPMVWVVSSSGKLLSLTYIPEQKISAWAQHDTDGVFESVAVVTENSEDVLYLITQRYVNGSQVRYIERLEMRSRTKDVKQSYHVDCGITYDGRNFSNDTVTLTGGIDWDEDDDINIEASADLFADVDDTVVLQYEEDDGDARVITITVHSVTDSRHAIGRPDFTIPEGLRGIALTDYALGKLVINGLDHLEGKTVSILADGGEMPQQVVSSGSVTLQHAAVVVSAGLPFISDLVTRPVAMQIEGYGKGRTYNVNKLYALIDQTSGLFAGPAFDKLTEYRPRNNEPYGTPPLLRSGQSEVNIRGAWTTEGQVYIRQTSPLPVSILGLTMDVTIGG